MLSNGFETPLRLQLKSSKSYLCFQLAANLLAIVAISIPSAIPLPAELILLVFVVFSLINIMRKYKQGVAVEKLWVWQKDETWIESLGETGRLWQCQQNNLVTPWFVIVRLSNETDNHSLFITKDQCDKDTFRRLCVRLKYYQGEAAIPTDAS